MRGSLGWMFVTGRKFLAKGEECFLSVLDELIVDAWIWIPNPDSNLVINLTFEVYIRTKLQEFKSRGRWSAHMSTALLEPAMSPK